jgi:hypothetical protein
MDHCVCDAPAVFGNSSKWVVPQAEVMHGPTILRSCGWPAGLLSSPQHSNCNTVAAFCALLPAYTCLVHAQCSAIVRVLEMLQLVDPEAARLCMKGTCVVGLLW